MIFEDFIIKCCEMKEWDLRNMLRDILQTHGFTILEDDYISDRGEKYKDVHNMLAIRGTPRVCLVAHTDVCRDYCDTAPDIEAVIKTLEDGGTIIQSKNCDVQVGGDDRLGVAINTWLAINNKIDMALLFTTDEEAGAVSANHCNFKELKEFELLVQVDRGNHSNQLVWNIGGTRLCKDNVVEQLLQISKDIGLERYRVQGYLTDVLALTRNGMCKNAVNMTCGYHNSLGAQEDEYIGVREAKDTMKYVDNIVKYYAAGKDLIDSPTKPQSNTSAVSDNKIWV